MPAKALDPHLRVFQSVRGMLAERGYSPSSYKPPAVMAPEIPYPALFPVGDVGDIDLAAETANFPHRLRYSPPECYNNLFEGFLRKHAGTKGRPYSITWDGVAHQFRTSVRAIMTPMRSGMYGLPRGVVGVGYHLAEFAYLVYRAFPYEADLTVDEERRDFHTLLDGRVYGVVGNEAVTPEGDVRALDHEFRISKLLSLRPAGERMLVTARDLWRPVYLFVIENDLAGDTQFMQALAHCRWALPPDLEWFDGPGQAGKPGVKAIVPTLDRRVMLLEAARLKLLHYPHIEMRPIRRMLVPKVIPLERWKADIEPITRFKKKGRKAVMQYLWDYQEEVRSQA